MSSKTIMKLAALKKLIFHKCKDQITFFETFKGSGLEDDVASGRYISTLVASFADGGGLKSSIMCSGQDKKKYMALLKGMMEFLERFAYKNISENPQLTTNNLPLANFDGFFNLLEPCMLDTTYKNNFWVQRVLGKDLINNKDVALPSIYMVPGGMEDRKRTILYRPTSSGFAAHFSYESAIEGGLLELIERDAFIRWWMQPETAEILSASTKFQKSLDLFITALSKAINNDLLEARLLLLSSPLSVPVVLAFLTSRDKEKPPAFLVGAGCSYEINIASSKALQELSASVLNLIARARSNPAWQSEKKVEESFTNFSKVAQHISLYQEATVRGALDFLPLLLSKKPKSTLNEDRPKNFNELLSMIAKSGMHCYGYDATPELFANDGLTVARAVVPELYPLYFGFPLPFKTERTSALSVYEEVPHCFP